MKKILISIGLITITSVLAIQATRAYSDSQTNIFGNTFAMGTLKIEDVSDSWMLNVNFAGLKPGDRIRKWVVLKNVGDLDIGSLSVSAINKTGSQELLDQITVSVYGQVEGFEQGVYTPDWRIGKPVNAFLNNVDILGTALYRNDTAAHILAAGKKDIIILDFFVPASLDNNYQGVSSSFDLQFNASQVVVPSQYF